MSSFYYKSALDLFSFDYVIDFILFDCVLNNYFKISLYMYIHIYSYDFPNLTVSDKCVRQLN